MKKRITSLHPKPIPPAPIAVDEDGELLCRYKIIYRGKATGLRCSCPGDNLAELLASYEDQKTKFVFERSRAISTTWYFATIMDGMVYPFHVRSLGQDYMFHDKDEAERFADLFEGELLP